MLRRLLPAALAVAALLAPTAAAARSDAGPSSLAADAQLNGVVPQVGPATGLADGAASSADGALGGARETLPPFDAQTQSHPGACSRETMTVAQAVGDFDANGVLASFAQLVGVHGSQSSLSGAMDKRLVLGTVQHKVVTENHGCDGEGDWFAVGPRTLPAGQRVGVKVSSRLRARACARASRRCKPVILSAHVVFPINCWNPNMGSVKVRIYVRKPPAKAPKSFKEVHKPKRHPRKPLPAPAPAVTPPPVAAPAPSAVASLDCGAGGVLVTLSNASSATAAATFAVDGKSYGPLAPGASETVTIPLASGTATTVTVTSGASTLIASQPIVDACAADPSAVAVQTSCDFEGEQPGLWLEYELRLSNAPSATVPASFVVEWTNGFGEQKTAQYGPLAPGAQVDAPLWIESMTGPGNELTISSAGKTLFSEEVEAYTCGG